MKTEANFLNWIENHIRCVKCIFKTISNIVDCPFIAKFTLVQTVLSIIVKLIFFFFLVCMCLPPKSILVSLPLLQFIDSTMRYTNNLIFIFVVVAFNGLPGRHSICHPLSFQPCAEPAFLWLCAGATVFYDCIKKCGQKIISIKFQFYFM